MRRFEFSEGVSNKFWEVEQDGCALHIRYGKLGTAGQEQTKTHPDQATAGAAMEKLIREKTGKGYLESAAAPPAPAAQVPLPPAPALPAGVAPWLAVGALVAMPAALAGQAMPSRRVPGVARRIDADACWEDFKPLAQFCEKFHPALCDPAYREAVAETIDRIANDRRRGSKESDVILLCLEKEKRYVHGAEPDTSFTDFLVADKGLPYAVDVFLQKLGTRLASDCIDEVRMFGITAAVGSWCEEDGNKYNETDLTLREHLAHATGDEWERCAQLMRQAAPSLAPWRRPLLAVLLPDAPELANELALSLQTPEGEAPGQWHRHYVWLDAYATSDAATRTLRRWPQALRRNYSDLCGTQRLVATLIQDRGADALSILRASGYGEAWDGMACIGTLASMTDMTLAYGEMNYYFDRYLAAAQRWPQAAIAVLSESIARDGCGPARARQVLASVVAAHAGSVPAFKPWLSAPAWKVLSTAAAQYITVRDIADTADLPPVLVNPPWQARPKKGAPMGSMPDDDPLMLYPAKIGKLPAFWTPLVWTRPLLASNGKALPDATLDIIGTMLRFPHDDRVYAGVTQLKQACTPASLADFAWELFRAWVEDGAPPKENWAFRALGMLGDDDCARKLTPLLRAWPGENKNARAVAGLDVLAMIGSDTALMLLNGIASKLKFKALQEKAREKIAAIAEARGLNAEELDDRLAPDLDLDQQGEMLLDFGTRQFRVGFDEALKPYVRDDAGARLPDLPKPKKTDDAELSADAVARFKLLKKDARTIAAQQVLRLEMAMCAQRRWQPQVFGAVLAGHPLLRHLVRRLVWGVYTVADGGSYGGQLLACFRVAPEGGYTNADDDAFELPQDALIRVGVPHALDLAPSDAAAFGQLFADYELLQPFAQIGRDIHALDADETDRHGLWRWGDAPVATGRVLGLVNRGWHRAPAEDAGQIHEFSKRLGDGHVAVLHISPGLSVGNVGAYPEQTLDHVLVGRADERGGMAGKVALSSLDPVLVSELIRDIEQLCA